MPPAPPAPIARSEDLSLRGVPCDSGTAAPDFPPQGCPGRFIRPHTHWTSRGRVPRRLRPVSQGVHAPQPEAKKPMDASARSVFGGTALVVAQHLDHTAFADGAVM